VKVSADRKNCSQVQFEHPGTGICWALRGKILDLEARGIRSVSGCRETEDHSGVGHLLGNDDRAKVWHCDVPWPPDRIVRMILLPPRLIGRQQMKLAARAFLVDNSLS